MPSIIDSLIGKSPIASIKAHMQLAHQCVSTLNSFFLHTLSDDWDSAENLQIQIKAIENEADRLKNEIRANLPRTLLMPFARADVIALLAIQDRLANKAKDIAGLMLGRKMQFPAELAQPITELMSLSVRAASVAQNTTEEFSDLLKVGLDSSRTDVETLLEELDRIESESDEKQISIRAALFAIEKDLNPVDVMFYYKVITLVGNIADVSQRVGNRITILLSK